MDDLINSFTSFNLESGNPVLQLYNKDSNRERVSDV